LTYLKAIARTKCSKENTAPQQKIDLKRKKAQAVEDNEQQ
jgi:hypothetical protein